MLSITKKCFYGSNLQTLQQNFRGNNMSRVKQLPEKNGRIVKENCCFKSQRHANTQLKKKDLKNIRFDADGFKVPNQEAPCSMTVQNFRDVRSYILHQTKLIQLMEENEQITSLRLPKLPKHLKNSRIKDWINFKKYQGTHESCRSITYVNGGTRIRILTSGQSKKDCPLRTEVEVGSHLPAFQRPNLKASASKSNDTTDIHTPTGNCVRKDSKTTSLPSNFVKSPEPISKLHGKLTNKFLEENYDKDLVDEPASLGLELIRLNYEDSIQRSVAEDSLIDHGRASIDACDDHFILPKGRATLGQSSSDTIGKLNHCFVRLKRIDESGRLEDGLQAMGRTHPDLMKNSNKISQTGLMKSSSVIFNPVPKDAEVNRRNAVSNKVSFPKDFTHHYGTNDKYQVKGNPMKNSLQPCYVKLKILGSQLESSSKTRTQLPVKRSSTSPYEKTLVKECSVRLHKMKFDSSIKSRTKTCRSFQRVQKASKLKSQETPKIWEEQDWNSSNSDCKRCLVLIERLD